MRVLHAGQPSYRYPTCFAQGSLREVLRSIASYLRQPLALGNGFIEAMRSNASAGKLTVESRQSVQRPIGLCVTELQQIHSLLVSLFFIPVRVNGLVGEAGSAGLSQQDAHSGVVRRGRSQTGPRDHVGTGTHLRTVRRSADGPTPPVGRATVESG